MNITPDESVLYLNEDKEKPLNWFDAHGAVAPLGGTIFGIIKMVSLSEEVVNALSNNRG